MSTTAIDTNNNLTTLVQVRLYVQSTASTANNSRLNGLIDAVSHDFNNRTGRLLKRRTSTEYYDGSGSADLYLRRYPIRSLSSGLTVRVVGSRTDFTTETTEFSTATSVPSSYLAVYSSEGRLHRIDGAFTAGHLNVKVAYDAGYSVSSGGISREPSVLKGSCEGVSSEGGGRSPKSGRSPSKGGRSAGTSVISSPVGRSFTMVPIRPPGALVPLS